MAEASDEDLEEEERAAKRRKLTHFEDGAMPLVISSLLNIHKNQVNFSTICNELPTFTHERMIFFQ